MHTIECGQGARQAQDVVFKCFESCRYIVDNLGKTPLSQANGLVLILLDDLNKNKFIF